MKLKKYRKKSNKVVSVFTIFGAIMLGITSIWLYNIIQHDMALSEFYEETWNPIKNGFGNRGKMVNISELAARPPKGGIGSSEEWCEGIESERGRITLTTIEPLDNKLVCCWADRNELHIPFKDKNEQRYYMCGNYPHIDVVKQSLQNATK